MKPRKPEASDRLTQADVLVLAMLAARPTHGYDLVTELGRRDTGEGAAVSRAQIYYSLKKLKRARAGWIVVVDGPDSAAHQHPAI